MAKQKPTLKQEHRKRVQEVQTSLKSINPDVVAWRTQIAPPQVLAKIRFQIPLLYRQKRLKVTDEYCLEWLQDIKNKKPPLLIGKTGVGKTHTLFALCLGIGAKVEEINLDLLKNAVPFNKPNYVTPAIKVVTSIQLINKIRRGIDLKITEHVLKTFCEFDVLMLDDFGAEKITEWVKEQFFLILDYRLQWRKQTIIASNLYPEEIALAHGERIASRLFELCHPVIIKGKDRRLK